MIVTAAKVIPAAKNWLLVVEQRLFMVGAI
jgi:hypothetical protein